MIIDAVVGSFWILRARGHVVGTLEASYGISHQVYTYFYKLRSVFDKTGYFEFRVIAARNLISCASV